MNKVLPKLSITLFSRLVIIYMLLAFSWWAYHLWEQNDRLFEAHKAILELRFYGKNNGVNTTQLEGTSEYRHDLGLWQSGRRMIVAEGLFFTICLIFGLYMMRRSANREVSLARERRNFLLSITHELKSPIAAMRLALDTLLKRKLNEEQHKQLVSNGLKDADRLQQLVEDLLLAARLEDKWQPVREPLDLAALAADCAEMLKARFPAANIQVQSAETLPAVIADKPGMTAVLKNLMENAVKYSTEGSPVFVSLDMLEGKHRIQITDQGRGIPDGEKRKVFEKFYRVGNEETRSSTGTGLGLYIVNQVVKAHHGAISLRDNQPQGSVFTISV